MNDETTIASIDFLVSLDTSTTPYVLTVTGNNKVGKSNNKQPLTWKLDGALKHGEFVGMDDCRPGFERMNWPPPDPAINDKAQPQGKDKLAINDTNPITGGSEGRWYYKLRVLLNGQIYETPLTAPEPVDVDVDDPCTSKRMMVGNNPVIINR